MAGCEICMEFIFPPIKHIDSMKVRDATELGFTPQYIKDIVNVVKNPKATAEDVWLHELKSMKDGEWIVCQDCYNIINRYVNKTPENDSDGMYDTFISYAAEDSEFANRLAGGLIVHGLKIWYAPISLNIGDNILSGIEKCLRDSRT